MPVFAKSISHMDQNERVIIPPYYGEFGWLVMTHIRYVEAHPAKVKIVFAERGTECLYPSATKIITFDHPVKADTRWANTVYDRGGQLEIAEHRAASLSKANRDYPDCTVIEPHYDCRWHTSDGIKVVPRVSPILQSVDVVLGVRKRSWAEYNNYQHWQSISESLMSMGLTVGICGVPSTSEDVPATVRAWDHPDGPTSGTIDLLQKCRLYVGTDTGVSHLAAMIDTPMVVFYLGGGRSPNELGVMQRANKGFIKRLDQEPSPQQLLKYIETSLKPTIAIEIFASIFHCPPAVNLSSSWVSGREVDCIAALIDTFKCRRIVEIGVQEGSTASVLLARCPSIESYTGVDVPPSHIPTLDIQRREVPQSAGSLVRDSRFSTIVRHHGSLELTSADLGEADLVFIDGDHARGPVESDTRLARSIVRPGGVIVWHDYGNPELGVSEVIDELNKLEGRRICHIAETSLCFELRS